MKYSRISTPLMLLSLSLLTAVNCDDTETFRVGVHEPIYTSPEELRQPITSADPRQLHETGKIYIKDHYIFINERRKGVHVIDNHDPESPRNIAFIPIPGNIDIAVQDNILYGDSYTDLVALDITNPSSVVQVKRIENIFENPFLQPRLMYGPQVTFDSWDWEYKDVDPSKGVVTGWKRTGTRIVESPYESGFGCASETGGDSNPIGDVGLSSTSGKGGSMAKFTIVEDILYTLNAGKMQLFRIDPPSNPTKWADISVAWDIETIFPYKNMLFIGSMSGMYIFDNSNPAEPFMIADFSHATSCDPVFVQDDYAYVTLRGGTPCGGFDNQLDIIDIEDPTYPRLLSSFAMQGPYGLAADGDTLFVCDGEAGVKIFNTSDVMDLKLISQIADYSAYDIILNDDIAMVVSPQGLYQYDYSNLDDIRLLSSIVIADQ